MRIEKLEKETGWDEYLIKKGASFTQSINWGKLKAKNQRVERLKATEDGSLVGVCQFLEEENPFGEYFYVPYGPVGDSIKVRDKLVKEIVKIGEKEKKSFVKVEPKEEIGVGNKSPHRIQPQKTLIRSIKESPEDILKSFDKETRYSVRYSRRKGVQIKSGKSKKYLDHFSNLLRKTKDRQEFKSFSLSYFENILSVMDSDLFLAFSKNGEVVAATIFGYFGKMATSLHSAFDYEKRKLRATYLIRYRAMLRAKEKGCEKFNAWAVDEDGMEGVTKFKEGFGGKKVSYPEGRDLPINKIKYQGYSLAAKILK